MNFATRGRVFAGTLAVCVCATWVGLSLGARSSLQANPTAVAAHDLIALTLPHGDHRQQLVLVDPARRVIGVYQVDAATGEIALRSVRNVSWDLQLAEFNSAAPLPREIRSVVEQR